MTKVQPLGKVCTVTLRSIAGRSCARAGRVPARTRIPAARSRVGGLMVTSWNQDEGAGGHRRHSSGSAEFSHRGALILIVTLMEQRGPAGRRGGESVRNRKKGNGLR